MKTIIPKDRNAPVKQIIEAGDKEYKKPASGSTSELLAGNWVRIPHQWAQEGLKDLRPTERWALIVLKSYKGKEGLIYPSLRTLSDETGFSLRGIARIIKRLEKLKKIKIIRTKGKENHYQMLC